ncbi:MAG: hypothetical protein JNK14_05270 [Chitinophagaceae bacterium]|nr:hypothetical protein [Chitinophagaceae bacterium]
MKRKAIYLFLIICSLSLFSSAKQMGKGAEYDMNKEECVSKKARSCGPPDRAAAYEISPLRLFLLSI